jgi:hypothetical protein
MTLNYPFYKDTNFDSYSGDYSVGCSGGYFVGFVGCSDGYLGSYSVGCSGGYSGGDSDSIFLITPLLLALITSTPFSTTQFSVSTGDS